MKQTTLIEECTHCEAEVLHVNERVIAGLLLLVAVIHLLPVSGFWSTERLAALYRVDVLDNNLEILMRHRAVLFGVLGVFFAYAAFKPAVQPLAFFAGLVSTVSFPYLSVAVGEFNDAIRNVVVADIAASLALVLAMVLYAAKPAG